MSAIEAQLAAAVNVFAWNGSGTQIALCANTNDIQIYSLTGDNTYKLTETLTGHDLLVTGLDWAPTTNRLLSCSQDRNAYVWTQKEAGGQWKPELVLLRSPRAATCCKWAPNEKKFAIGTSAKFASVCHFDDDNNWWVSKSLKGHESTVLCLAWHPSSVLLLTGCADFRVRLFTATVRGVDERKGHKTVWGDSFKFNEELASFETNGWVHDVAWSPSGNRLAYACHNSTVTIVSYDGGNPEAPVTQLFRLRQLPVRALSFASEDMLIGAGHTLSPLLFRTSGSGAPWAGPIEVDTNSGAENAQKAKQSSVASTLARFQQQSSRGQDTADAALKTVHQSAISCLRVLSSGDVMTSGFDGKLVRWRNVGSVEAQMGALKV